MRASQKFSSVPAANQQTKQREEISLKEAFNILIKDCAFTQAEIEEIHSLIDYRNVIAHEIEELFLDLSPTKGARLKLLVSRRKTSAFDQNEIYRIQKYREKFDNLYKTHPYIFVVGMDDYYFAPVERFLKQEIKRAESHIAKLTIKRKCFSDKISNEIDNIHREFRGENHPFHPRNKREDGRLSDHGVKVCHRLFEGGFSNAAIAHSMHVKLRTVERRRKIWVSNYRTEGS